MFVLAVIGANIAIGPRPAHCRDGWQSSSIGAQGACSWHGGVAGDPWGIVVLLAGLVGGGAGFFGTIKWETRNDPPPVRWTERYGPPAPPSPPSRLTMLLAQWRPLIEPHGHRLALRFDGVQYGIDVYDVSEPPSKLADIRRRTGLGWMLTITEGEPVNWIPETPNQLMPILMRRLGIEPPPSNFKKPQRRNGRRTRTKRRRG